MPASHRKSALRCVLSGLLPACVLAVGGLGVMPGAVAQEMADEVVVPRAADAPATQTRLEGAVGLSLGYRPEYSGGSRQVLKTTPGVFLRWGRYTLTNASGFATRRSDDVAAGLGVDMVRNERVRLGLSLRIDQGRNESSASAFAGLGNIRPTVRLRAAGSWRLEGPWRLGAAWSLDALGRGGGDIGELSAGWEHRTDADTLLNLGLSLSVGGRRYMQSYYGISADQAARSTYAVYTPGAGLRDAGLYANWRHDIGREWILLAGCGFTRLLGPAADSPLSTSRSGWAFSTGAARTF